MKYDSDILREIEMLARKQLRSVAELMENPDDADARHHFRERQALIRALRMQLSTQKKRPAEAGL